MKILITGATGFIGGRIAEALTEDGHSVVTSGRNPKKAAALEAKGIAFVRGDLSDPACADTVCEGAEMVIHCAGLAGAWGEYEAYYKANVLSTRYLLQAARKAGTKRFINLSSPSIYFDFRDQTSLKETDLPPRFSNHYARTKYEAEQLVDAAHGPEFFTVSLRPRFVIGAGDANILPRMIRLQKAGMLKRIGRGENVVDITTVGNLVDAVKLCMEAPPEAMGEVYNISNGEPIRFWDFVDMVMRKSGTPVERATVPYGLAMTAARLNAWWCRLIRKKEEPRLLPISVAVLAHSMTLSIDKARTRLGYTPRQTTEEGVDEFLDWFGYNGNPVSHAPQ